MKPQKRTGVRTTRSDDGNAFLPDNTDGSAGATKSAADAEYFGEEYIGAATAGESMSEDMRDEVSDEEEGGPFIVLGEDGELPPMSQEGDIDNEGHDAFVLAQGVRGANWAARGA